LLDGAGNNDVFTATVGQRVPLDSVPDSGLHKRSTEIAGLQSRFEVFNVFNYSNLYVIPGQTDGSSFNFVPAPRGVTSSNVQERGDAQLAAKITF
jgi:hypothetical protein